MNKKILIIVIICFVFVSSATSAFAALTFSATTISSDGTLTLTPNAGSSVILNGNIGILNTTSSTTGVIMKGVNRFIHNYSEPGSDGSNIFIGMDAGNFTLGPGGGASDLGSYNNSIGDTTLDALTTGNSNDAFGWGALSSNTTGSHNDAMGDSALFENTEGNDNTALGNSALTTNTTGSFNVGVGPFALGSNTTGSNNTAVGDSALSNLNITADDGSGNNTGLGHFTGQGLVTGINNTIIGANVSGLAAGMSNNIIIADGEGNRRINVDATGNVGIGTNTPNANAILDVTSTTKAFMPPRMTTVQRNAIASPTAGMVIYNTTTNKLNVYTTTWEQVTSS